MLFKKFGDKSKPAVILLHGGGLSWWSFRDVIKNLKDDYYVIAVVIDGHGEDSRTDFLSIEDSAKKLIEYIDLNLGGHLHILAGLSLGAQIVAEAISIRKDIAEYAVIESALIIPLKCASAISALNIIFYRLIRQKWFSRMQAKALAIPDSMFEFYFHDSVKITKTSLINISLSNLKYLLKKGISETEAKVLILVGEKELGLMKKSAKTLHEKIKGSSLYILPGMRHGELSISRPQEYVDILKKL